MAGSKSDWLENAVVNTILGKSEDLASLTPSTLYLALTNSTINDAWTGTTGEVAGGNYERLAVENSTDSWEIASTGGTVNKINLLFTSNASGGWGTVRAFALIDSTAGSGNVFYWGDLVAPVVVSAGNTVQFSTGSLVIGEL